MKPLVGIPCYRESLPHEVRPRFMLYQSYVNALAAAGAAPVLIPSTLDREADESIFERMDAIVLAGGDDVNPACYGQELHAKTEVPDDARDEVEIALARWAVAHDKPLMAICRGMQVLNVALGGTLIQDIGDLVPGAVEHSYPYDSLEARNKTTHEVTIEPGARLSKVFGTCADVNSFHHQALGQVADGFRIVGRAPDGVIEAVESTDSASIFGVQWHPEDMFSTDPTMLALFKMFVDSIG